MCLSSLENRCKHNTKRNKSENFTSFYPYTDKTQSHRCCQFIDRRATSVDLIAIKDLPQHTGNKEKNYANCMDFNPHSILP